MTTRRVASGILAAVAVSTCEVAFGETGPAPASDIRSFALDDTPPRWIALEGRTGNVRDLGGADRTGSLAYVLNGVLGVSKHDLECDWESTMYPNIPNVVENTTGKPFPNGTYWRSSRHFDDGFAKYARPGDTLRDRVQAYLLDCGVTEDEIRRVREIMLD